MLRGMTTCTHCKSCSNKCQSLSDLTVCVSKDSKYMLKTRFLLRIQSRVLCVRAGAAWRPCMPSGLQQIRISSDSGANAKLANGGPKTQAKSPAVVRARLGGSAAATQLRLSGNAASLEAAAKPPVVTMLQEMDSSNQLGASILRAASGFWQGFNAGLASAAVQTSQSG